MNEIISLKFIQGEFSAEEANALLLNILKSKIDFHELKNIQSKERIGKSDNNAQQRVQELKSSRSSLLEVLKIAVLENKKLQIDSEINLTVIN
jgi:hypothetical protein